MKTPRLLLAGTAAAALLLSGCGMTNAAAIVDGERISESAVLETTEQVNSLSGQQLPPGAVVQQLIVLPTVLDVLGERGVRITDSAARSALSGVSEPSPYLVEIARLQLAMNELGDEDFAVITERLADLDVSVNPRFGTFDSENFTVNATTPDWIVDGA